MSFVIKLLVIGAGLIALYGLATGADLNLLFDDVLSKVIPFATDLFDKAVAFVKDIVADIK